jgi:hydroxymethylglutaryl-CoA reductase
MVTKKESSLRKFYQKTIAERQSIVADIANFDLQEKIVLSRDPAPEMLGVYRSIENVIALTSLPLSVATHFIIDGRDVLIPMAIEEASVVAGVSHAAKLARAAGGFCTSVSPAHMIGQILLCHINDLLEASQRILAHKQELLAIANKADIYLGTLGGGAFDINTKFFDTVRGPMLAIHLLVDVKDAMGANIVNAMVERISPMVEKLVGGSVRMRIVSNLATERLASARAVWKNELLGQSLIDGILDAQAFAYADHHRCATHNKGVMNGIDAVAVATGNDWRAIEAGAHAYAARDNGYKPLTHYEQTADGDLVGTITLPLAVGIVGGMTKNHPIARLAIKILGVTSAQQLAGIMAAVGLAQNFAALRVLVSEGIQRGHMKLSSYTMALSAGASHDDALVIASCMCQEKEVSFQRAKELVDEYVQEKKSL